MKHPDETLLALHASGDLRGWPRVAVAWHARRCPECKDILEAYRGLRAEARNLADALPEGLIWDRLANEMTANIRLGLAAGEIVASSVKHPAPQRGFWNRRPAAAVAVAGLAILAGGVWWLYVPSRDPAAAVASSGEAGPVVSATPAGVEFRENGSALGLSLIDAKPVEVSLSLSGSASAHYVDEETGQVTITTVYVQ